MAGWPYTIIFARKLTEMASIEINIPYTIPQQEALTRIKNLLTETRNEHAGIIKNLQENWDGNTGTFSFTAQGFDISGTLTVNPGIFNVDAQVPLALTMFKGAITKAITDKASQLLA
jgi:hypothetical protein